VVIFQLPRDFALPIRMGLLALLPSSCILLALSLSIALLDALQQSKIVFTEGLDDCLETDLSFTLCGRLLSEVELREGFDGRLGHAEEVSLTNDRNNMPQNNTRNQSSRDYLRMSHLHIWKVDKCYIGRYV
jgi:hypothetical protein